MDVSERDLKRGEDHLWQFNHQIVPSSMENPVSSLPAGWTPGILPGSLANFPADSGFIERAARFSCFSGGNISAMMNNPYIANEPFCSHPSASRGVSDSQSPINNDQRDSCKAEVSGDRQENSSSRGSGANKRKRDNKDNMELDQGKGASPLSLENTKESLETKKSSAVSNSKSSGKNAKDGADGAKEDYIHVRARRGQATNSHSLAERVRREKISERMKFLQELVPGCSKVTGKAVMLDEIINYVQSLQRQVEFLSMKLAAVNPRLDFNIEGLLSKDLLHLRGGSSSGFGFSPEIIRQQLHPSRQGLVQAGMHGMASPSDALRRAISDQLTSMPQMTNAWEDELHNVVPMNFGSSPAFNIQEQGSKPCDGFPL